MGFRGERDREKDKEISTRKIVSALDLATPD